LGAQRGRNTARLIPLSTEPSNARLAWRLRITASFLFEIRRER
jgi:hypothetical protein